MKIQVKNNPKKISFKIKNNSTNWENLESKKGIHMFVGEWLFNTNDPFVIYCELKNSLMN